MKRQRFSFVKDGIASPWYEKPRTQVAAITRKHFGLSIGLWKHLVQAGRIHGQCQVLQNGTWGQV